MSMSSSCLRPPTSHCSLPSFSVFTALPPTPFLYLLSLSWLRNLSGELQQKTVLMGELREEQQRQQRRQWSCWKKSNYRECSQIITVIWGFNSIRWINVRSLFLCHSCFTVCNCTQSSSLLTVVTWEKKSHLTWALKKKNTVLTLLLNSFLCDFSPLSLLSMFSKLPVFYFKLPASLLQHINHTTLLNVTNFLNNAQRCLRTVSLRQWFGYVTLCLSYTYKADWTVHQR